MEESLKNNKKRIKFVATIGDKENIIRELEKRVEEPTIPENSEKLKKQLESFKKNFGSESYNNADVFSKYMSNKTGKYIVVCKTTEHMYQIIRKAHELFDKVNPNINVSYIGKRIFDSAKEEMIKKFEEQEDDGVSLNLLFLNKATTKHYNAYNLDGVILFTGAKNHTKRNLAIVNEALKSCKESGVTIQIVDSIDTISKYDTLQKCVNEEEQYIVDFGKSKSFTVTETFRSATYSKRIDENLKLKLMKQYKEETGKDITFKSEFNGYKIGSWKNNLRQEESNGRLDIDEELRKEFEKEGILGDRLRRIRTTDEDKYNLLLKFNEKNPDTEITTNTIDEKGIPIGEYRAWLQTKVNRKTSQLTPKQIAILKELGYLNLSSTEIKELSERFKLSEANIKNIIKEYKSIKKFISEYKKRKSKSQKYKIKQKRNYT